MSKQQIGRNGREVHPDQKSAAPQEKGQAESPLNALVAPAISAELAQRKVTAFFDSEGIYVYQAFTKTTAENALKKGTFGAGFNLHRMSWIKPSLGWMMHRSSFGTAQRQEHVMQIHMKHEGFLHLLSNAALSHFDPLVHESAEQWKSSLAQSSVRIQWDPERDLQGNKVPFRRAIQIGISEEFLPRYVNDWIIKIADISTTVASIRERLPAGVNHFEHNHPYPEQEYTIPPDIALRIGMLPKRGA